MGLIIFIVGTGLLVFLLIGGGIWLILSEKAKARRQADPFTFEANQELFQASSQSGVGLPRHLRPTPEARPGSYFDGGCILLFSLFWTSISFFFLIFPLVMFWQELQDYVLLKNTGQTAEAVIIDRRIDYDSEGDDYYVTYQFTALRPQGDRKRFSREQSVDRDTYDNLPPESRITVVYAPSDPTVSRPLDWLEPPYYLLFIAALGGLFVFVGVVLFIAGWQGIAKSRKLSRRGQLIQAVAFRGAQLAAAIRVYPTWSSTRNQSRIQPGSLRFSGNRRFGVGAVFAGAAARLSIGVVTLE